MTTIDAILRVGEKLLVTNQTRQTCRFCCSFVPPAADDVTAASAASRALSSTLLFLPEDSSFPLSHHGRTGRGTSSHSSRNPLPLKPRMQLEASLSHSLSAANTLTTLFDHLSIYASSLTPSITSLPLSPSPSLLATTGAASPRPIPPPPSLVSSLLHLLTLLLKRLPSLLEKVSEEMTWQAVIGRICVSACCEVASKGLACAAAMGEWITNMHPLRGVSCA